MVKEKIVEQKESVAFLKSIKISPIKLQAVARGIQGLTASKAIMLLTFSKKAVSDIVNVLLKSAIANAENNHGMDIDALYVERVDVGKSMVLKRSSPRARGRSDRIKKPFSNLRIVLKEKKESK
jgi:large subunit ribosomal protein L22